MEEIWKPVIGCVGYEANKLGYIRNSKTKRILVGSTDKRGYKRTLLSENGCPVTKLTHRLIANTFISNKEKKPCINHIDGNPSNNCINNLEWVTYSENNLHSIKQGRRFYFSGTKNKNSILNLFNVIEIRSSNLKGVVLANKFGVTPSTISNIRLKKTWKSC